MRPFLDALLVRSRVTVVFVLQMMAWPAAPQEPSATPVVVVGKWQPGRVTCKTDSVPFTDLLRCFDVALDRNHSGGPIAVWVDSSTPIEALWDLQAIAGKAQATNLRFFVVFRGTGTIAEIGPLPPVRAKAAQ